VPLAHFVDEGIPLNAVRPNKIWGESLKFFSRDGRLSILERRVDGFEQRLPVEVKMGRTDPNVYSESFVISSATALSAMKWRPSAATSIVAQSLTSASKLA
jgi:hypothetical protein